MVKSFAIYENVLNLRLLTKGQRCHNILVATF
jgi:hypothetical protein